MDRLDLTKCQEASRLGQRRSVCLTPGAGRTNCKTEASEFVYYKKGVLLKRDEG